MSVWCNACGRLSQDAEFCDHCNADLATSGQPLPPERCPLLEGGVPLSDEQRRALAFPEASALIRLKDQAWRVHWIADREWAERQAVLQKRLALRLPALAQGRLVKDEGGHWAIFEAADTELPWNISVADDPLLELQHIADGVQALAQTLDSLHRQGLVWLRFDPNALEDAGPLANHPDLRQLRITNLDVELFPFQSMPERVRVHPQFAAPEIVQFRSDDIGPRTDVFHLALLTYYWMADKLPDGLAGEGLEQFDFDLPFLRIYAPDLPAGIVPVIRRGIAVAPRQRHASPLQFAAELSASIEHARRRAASTSAVRWEVGGHTRTGRAKEETHRINEDAILIKESDQGTLVAVADGVSTCDIGSGALASMMTTIVIENAFANGCDHETFRGVVSAATRKGSQGLLEWAIARGCKGDLLAGKDLMGTTLTIGWLQGHEFSLANLGDSRAYLLAGDTIEQLTVDGDLASDLLAQGVAPEEIRELGGMARALRECVGGCTKTPDGELSILPDSAHPRTSRWTLLPGDVLVLCSDGLVEEGYFLDPAAVLEIVRRHQDESASQIALRLVDAADELQRPPTMLEPDGFGDNISCVVVKILNASG